jgi:hypothetical protein
VPTESVIIEKTKEILDEYIFDKGELLYQLLGRYT